MASRRLVERMFAHVEIAPLVYARIVFGVVMFAEVIRYAVFGWIYRHYVEPTFRFTYPGFGWVKAAPGWVIYTLFVMLGVCALLITLGLFYRVAASAFAIGIAYVFLLDQANYLNHMYLICLLAALLAVVPAADAGSLDAWRRRESRQTAPAWCTWLVVGQLAVVYVFGGIAKIDPDWLSAVPTAMYLDDAGLSSLARSSVAPKLLAYGGLLFDLLVVPALLWRRTRWLATAAAVMFHVTNWQLFDIGVFPWLMLALTPMFWPAAWTRRLLIGARVLRSDTTTRATPPVEVRPGIVCALAIYAAFQVTMPLRHWLYPGNVNWTEEGHNFSWHMKLRLKEGEIRFVAVNQVSGQTITIAPEQLLTSRQAHKISTRPEMIRQLAQEIARRLRDDGWTAVEVHVAVAAQLNGRPMQLMIDPSIDLAARPFTLFAAADWIVPLEPVPPQFPPAPVSE
jgi:vitamin K-dependent gamma-carboxylase